MQTSLSYRWKWDLVLIASVFYSLLISFHSIWKWSWHWFWHSCHSSFLSFFRQKYEKSDGFKTEINGNVMQIISLVTSVVPAVTYRRSKMVHLSKPVCDIQMGLLSPFVDLLWLHNEPHSLNVETCHRLLRKILNSPWNVLQISFMTILNFWKLIYLFWTEFL